MKKIIYLMVMLVLISFVSADWVTIDNFNDNSFDSSLWTATCDGNNYYNESGGVLQTNFNDHADAEESCVLRITNPTYMGFNKTQMECKFSEPGGGAYANNGVGFGTITNGFDPKIEFSQNMHLTSTSFLSKVDDVTDITNSTVGDLRSSFHNYSIEINDTGTYWFVDGLLTTTSTDNSHINSSNKSIFLAGGQYSDARGTDIICNNVWYWVDSALFFKSPTPTDGSSESSLTPPLHINVSCVGGGNVTLWFDQLSNPVQLVLDTTLADASWQLNSTIVNSSSTFSYKASCDSGNINSSIRTFIFDNSTPEMTLNPTNFFTNNNLSTQSQYLDSVSFNITFTDEKDLFAYQINITKGGTHYFGELNQTINGTSFNYTRTINITELPKGRYDIQVQVADSSTMTKWGELTTARTTDKKVEFDTDEGLNIKVISQDQAQTQVFQKRDRYEFEFDFQELGSKNRQFDVYCDGKLYKRSLKKGHLVCSADGVSGNWIDFEGTESEPVITRITDNHYRLVFPNLESKTNFKSIGGLNVLTMNYTWYRGTTSLTETGNISNTLTTIRLNISKDSTISFINANLTYNGTLYNSVTKTIYTDFTLFEQIVNTPTSFNNFNETYFWNITYTDTANTSQNFRVYKNHSIIVPLIDNCSNTYGRTTNATAYIIKIYDQLTDISTNSNFNGKLNYLDTSYSFSRNSQKNISFCVYPNTFDNTVSGYIYYGGTGYATRYHEIASTQFNNVTQSLSLYLMNTTGTDVGNLIVQVFDEFYNYIVSANVKLLEYDSDLDSFVQVSQCFSDTNGECIFNVELDSKYYIAQATYTRDGEVLTAQSTTSGQLIKITNTIIELHLTTSETFELDDYYDLVITPSNTALVGNTSSLTATFDDATNRDHTVCVGYYTKNGLNEVEQSTTCVTASAGIVNFAGGYVLDRSYTYIAKIYTTDGNLTRVYNSYTYEAFEGTFLLAWGEHILKPFMFAILLLLLGFSLYLKNIKIFAFGVMGYSPVTLMWFPNLMGGITMSFIILMAIIILYLTAKKQTVG